MARRAGRRIKSEGGTLRTPGGHLSVPSRLVTANVVAQVTGQDAAQADSGGDAHGNDAVYATEREVGSAHAEPVRQIVQQLFRMPGSEDRQVVLFSALEAHAGASVLCSHVAETLAAQVDGRVCLVDADLRQPSLHHHFGVSAGPGLAEALNDGESIRAGAEVRANLWLVTAGSSAADPGVQFASDRTGQVFDEFRQQFNYVLVHAAPIGERRESLVLSRWTDGVVLIIQANRTLHSTARRVRDSLVTAGVPLLAVALTEVAPVPDILSRWL
ncbi:MAG: CpsD/CapB family tyrosine-protein kinase [Vicinamibacterales bacterium]